MDADPRPGGLRATGALPLDAVEESLGKVLRGAGKEGLFRLNRAALRAGYERVAGEL